MNSFRSSLFPRERFEKLKPIDGIIAISFFVYLIVITCAIFYLQKNNYIQILPPQGFPVLLFGLIMSAPSFIFIALVLIIRRQKPDTIGLCKKGLFKSIVFGLILICIHTAVYVFRHGFDIGFINKTIFYLIFVGFFEELVFRGFIWPRLVVLLGEVYGTALSGVLFGAAHAPMYVLLYNHSAVAAVLNNIGGGIAYSLLMIYIYTKSSNIMMPSLVHGLLDAMSLL